MTSFTRNTFLPPCNLKLSLRSEESLWQPVHVPTNNFLEGFQFVAILLLLSRLDDYPGNLFPDDSNAGYIIIRHFPDSNDPFAIRGMES